MTEFICDKCGHVNNITKTIESKPIRSNKSRISWRFFFGGKTLTQVIADYYIQEYTKDQAELAIFKELKKKGIVLTDVQKGKIHRSVECRFSELDSSYRVRRDSKK